MTSTVCSLRRKQLTMKRLKMMKKKKKTINLQVTNYISTLGGRTQVFHIEIYHNLSPESGMFHVNTDTAKSRQTIGENLE